nr:putative ribonuclease H-like domain-containing protein [Tanacetum cinerariifolium]
AYSDSYYVGASLDEKSTTCGCQFLGCRLISWQCKKQTVVATLSTEAEYVAAASCYAQALYGLHQAPRAWYETLANYLLENGFQRGKIDQTLFIKRLTDGKSASTPIDTEKPLLKDPDGEDVDVHIYRSMFGSLMYLTSSRPDIMFVVCACACFQVTPKASHIHAVKMIFRYLKGKPHLGLWYPKDSPFGLVAYSDGDYAGASLDRKSTTEGCQFLGCSLIFWQCKKQTVVATSSTKIEYVAVASCCAQVLWIQNQLLDYGQNWSYCWSSTINAARHFITAVSYELMLFGLMKVDAVNLMFLVKKFNGDVQLQDLIDDKKVIVTEAIIRRDLHLDDANGVECLSNAEIFDELARIAKRTAWNEFHSFIASVVICLATVHGEEVNAGDAAEGVMDTCIALTRRVEHLELDKVAQAIKITKLKQRVKKLERRNKGRMIAEMDQDADVVLEEAKEVAEDTKEPKPLKKKQKIEQDKKYVRELQAKLNKNIDLDEAIDHVKRKAKEDPAVERYQVLKRKPQTEAQARNNIMIKEQIEEEESRALKRLNETSAEKAAKRQKLDEEVEELKRHLQIVSNKDDDVCTEATPFARKCTWSNKGQGMEVIRIMWCADHYFYNYPADFVSRERKYPLTRFTLDQMLNAVRLEVEEESEVSLELLRFVRQQHQEGHLS